MINIKQQQDLRLQALEAWLATCLPGVEWTIKPLANDASFRRYFRAHLADGNTYVVMDAPPDKEPMAPFVAIASELVNLKLQVPVVHQADLTQGFLLLSDLGDTLYLTVLNENNADQLYQTAIESLLTIQTCKSVDDYELPLFDRDFCLAELERFRHWYLQTHLGLELSSAEHDQLQASFDLLTANAQAQPRVFVHRDYHSRNLMVLPDNQVGIIDFQDAVKGPITYDLVSLLRDCYIDWPRVKVEKWVRSYQQQALAKGIISEDDPVQFLEWFDWMGVQRHLKAIHIFARLAHRDGKTTYLQDIPRALGYVRAVCQRYDELTPLYQFLQDRVLKP